MAVATTLLDYDELLRCTGVCYEGDAVTKGRTLNCLRCGRRGLMTKAPKRPAGVQASAPFSRIPRHCHRGQTVLEVIIVDSNFCSSSFEDVPDDQCSAHEAGA